MVTPLSSIASQFKLPTSAITKARLVETPDSTNFLHPGDKLLQGQQIQSTNGLYTVVLQTDGNVVLYNQEHSPLWATGAMGADSFVMQTDGNLVAYQGKNPLWASDTAGQSNAFAIIQDDGNFVVYRREGLQPLWSSETYGGRVAPSHSSFLSDAIHILGNGISAVGGAIGSLPIIGTLATAVYNFQPFSLLYSIASGERVDKALVDDFSKKLQSTKEVAPYAETIISFVPGVGAGVNAAIAIAATLAAGKNISDALIAGIKNTLPGGPLAQAAFDLGQMAIKGENIAKATLDALQAQLPGGPAGQYIANLAKDIAAGKNVAASALNEIVTSLPAAAQTAITIGMAIGHGQTLQEIIGDGKIIIESASQVGDLMTAKDSLLKTAYDVIPDEAKKGYETAIGLYAYGKQLTENKVAAVRKLLTPAEQAAFDTATALQIGRYLPGAAPSNLQIRWQIAFYIAKGAKFSAPPAVAVQALTPYATTKDAKTAAAAGVQAAARLGSFASLSVVATRLPSAARLEATADPSYLQYFVNLVETKVKEFFHAPS